MEYEIYGATESADDNPQRDWTYLHTFKQPRSARKAAKKLSAFEKWHEIELRGEDKGEIIHHSYWRNGSKHIDMSV